MQIFNVVLGSFFLKKKSCLDSFYIDLKRNGGVPAVAQSGIVSVVAWVAAEVRV